jgi:hypothetical protein
MNSHILITPLFSTRGGPGATAGAAIARTRDVVPAGALARRQRPLQCARATIVFFLLFLLLLAPSLSATDATPVRDVVTRSGAAVSKFLEQFSRVTCTELVSQAKLRKNGKPEYQEDSTFELLVTPNAIPGELSIEETRQPLRQPKRRQNVPLLTSNGFSTFLLVFHPYYQGSFEFTNVGEERIDGHTIVRVRFDHIPKTPSPTALLLGDRQYPLELSGVAWVDAETGSISKVSASVSAMDDLGLRTFHSEVQYAPVTLPGANTFWLPSTATIDVETARQHWRNVHRFTSYKKFSVHTTITMPES